MELLIRAATIGDLPVVLDVWHRAEAVPSATDNEAALAALLDEQPDALLVATADGRVIGTVIATWDGWRGNYYRLAVLPEWRRQGVARSLIEAGEGTLRTRGALRVSALVVRTHGDATSTWTSCGYGRDDRIVRFVRTVR